MLVIQQTRQEKVLRFIVVLYSATYCTPMWVLLKSSEPHPSHLLIKVRQHRSETNRIVWFGTCRGSSLRWMNTDGYTQQDRSFQRQDSQITARLYNPQHEGDNTSWLPTRAGKKGKGKCTQSSWWMWEDCRGQQTGNMTAMYCGQQAD